MAKRGIFNVVLGTSSNAIISLKQTDGKTNSLYCFQMKQVLPEVYSIAEGCVSIAIFSIDCSSMTQ